MTYDFKLPDIGEGLTEGEIVKWHVKEGDAVLENQPLCNVLTDKAEVEVPSPKAGKIVKLFAQPGQKIKVHAPLVTLELGGASGAAPAAAPKRETPPAAQPKAASAAATTATASRYEFKLPDIGEGLTEGEVTKWHVKEGDSVQENQPLCNVLTDKAEVEIPSPKSGKVLKLFAKPGEKVKVHAPLLALELAASSTAAAAAPQAKVAETARPAAAAPRAAAAPGKSVSATPAVRQLAKSLGVDIAQLSGSGPDGRVLESDVRGAAAAGPASASATGASATPAVRALAAELGVDLSRVQGTGPGGRVAEWDVRKQAGPGGMPAARPAPQPSAPVPGEERSPFVGIRRKIAEKMSQSLHTAAHVTHMDECDMTALVSLREELKAEAAKRGVKVTYLPFIIRALVKTLAEFPQFNGSLDDERGEVVVKRFYNVGIAVSAGQGLVVPNIKNADTKDVWGLAAEVASLAEKVRSKKIDVPSLQGGTFTITNIGPIGGLFATPIINHPELAILGLMKLKKRPVVRENAVAIRDMMNLVLSFDHRVLDGADAAAFMNTLIKHLENPRTLL